MRKNSLALGCITLVAVAVGFTLSACESKNPPPTAHDAGVDAGPICLADPDADAGDDAGVDSDGGADAGVDAGPDLSCLNQPFPQGAQPTLELSGLVTVIGFTRDPKPGVPVDLFRRDGTHLASDVTDDAGAYQLSTATGCVPLDGYIKASASALDAGFYDSYHFAPIPWRTRHGGTELVLFNPASRMLVANIAGVTIRNGTGAVALTVVDCNARPIEGATLVVPDGGAVRYVDATTGFPSASLTATTSRGDAIVFNLDPGPVELNAVTSGTTLRPKSLMVHADSVTTTAVTP